MLPPSGLVGSGVASGERALVDVGWLAERLAVGSGNVGAGDGGAGGGAQEVVVFQVDGDASSFYTGHLPGALPLDWYDELLEQVRRGPVSREHFEQLMQRKGVAEDAHVVLVGVGDSAYAAHAFWLMRYYRHRRLSLLDGGRDAWVRAGLALHDSEPPARPVSRYRSPGPDPAVRVMREEVLARYVGAPAGTLVLDCRTPAEFEGLSRNPMDLTVEQHRVGGHIPGARNLPSVQLLDEQQQFLPVARLRELFTGCGLTDDADVIVYCRVAERSSLLWFALHELLEHPRARHYDGGWAEYGSLMDAPVARDGYS